MFGSDIIEVAIGMAFLYLFMSMIASAMREAIEAFMKRRATDLERGIQEMLRTDPKTGGANVLGLVDMLRSMLPMWLIGKRATDPAPFDHWADEFYNHPLVSSLFRGTYEQARATGTLPSYIPKENFALAILDLVAGASATGDKLSITTLEAALLKATPPNAIQRVVSIALSTAAGDIDNVKKSMEAWYDGTMSRVTGWYARHTAGILFVLGFGAAVFLNVDSITVAKSLLNDPDLRKAIVAQAEIFAKQGGLKQGEAASPEDAAAQKPEGGTSDATAGTDPEAPVPSGAPDAKGALTQSKSFDELRREFGQIGYPIGWTWLKWRPYPTPQGACALQLAKEEAKKAATTCEATTYFGMLGLSLMGWLITAIAVMLGAPFWFDMLNKLISIRAALKPPDNPKQKKPETP